MGAGRGVMNSDLILQPDNLALTGAVPIEQNPAEVYIRSLSTSEGRRVQRQALEVIANLLTGSPDLRAVPWAALRYEHTSTIRTRLAEHYSPATANRMLCALRGAIKAAWQLGQITEEQKARACDIRKIGGETLLAGRALSGGDLAALVGVCENDTSPAWG